MSSNTHHTLSLTFDKCEIVRMGMDRIFFTLAKTDMHGRILENLQVLHAGYDEFNSRCMKMETVSGNGPDLVRLLGWPLRIDIIEHNDKKAPLKYIEAWDYDCKILNVDQTHNP